MENFYLTLPSNSSSAFFPKNTISSFTTKLPKRFELNAPYECALAEMNYQHSWYNISGNDGVFRVISYPSFRITIPMKQQFKNAEKLVRKLAATIAEHPIQKLADEIMFLLFYNRIILSLPHGAEVRMSQSLAQILGFNQPDLIYTLDKENESEFLVVFKESTTAKDPPTFSDIDLSKAPFFFDFELKGSPSSVINEFKIPQGYYSNPAHLAQLMSNRIKDRFRYEEEKLPVQFTYNTITHRITLEITGYFKVIITKELSELLGFLGQTEFLQSTEAGSVIDLNGGFFNIFIYSDLIDNSIVGDVMAPLLRMVQIRGKDGDLITESYSNLFYRPLLRHSFDCISIYLRNDMGEPIKFERGRVTVTLHFRKVQ